MRGIHRPPVNSPHKGQWRGALLFSLICARINAWVNNSEAGDLRHNHAHYDVTLMLRLIAHINLLWISDLYENGKVQPSLTNNLLTSTQNRYGRQYMIQEVLYSSYYYIHMRIYRFLFRAILELQLKFVVTNSTIADSWRCHVIEMLSTDLAVCEGNRPVSGGFRIPPQKAINLELSCFILLAENTFWTILELPMVWDAITLMWHHCNAVCLWRDASCRVTVFKD